MAIRLDERNLGGRKFIYEQLYNHKKALKQVKPSVILTPPKAHVNQEGEYFGDDTEHLKVYEMGYCLPSNTFNSNNMISTVQSSIYGGGKSNRHKQTIEEKQIYSPEYAEIRETFKRVKNVKKGGIDANKPKSFHMSKKINENRRRNMFYFEEHIKNLASLQRRLNSIGSIQDRKKNPMDPLAYPSMFFRKPDDFDKSTTLTGFANKIVTYNYLLQILIVIKFREDKEDGCKI